MVLDRRRSARERRISPRAPLTAAVIQRVGSTTQLAQSSNIGPLGMTLRYVGNGSECLPCTPIALTFQLPGDHEVIEVRGRIVFDRSEGAFRLVGVRFDQIAPEDAGRIARYVAG